MRSLMPVPTKSATLAPTAISTDDKEAEVDTAADEEEAALPMGMGCDRDGCCDRDSMTSAMTLGGWGASGKMVSVGMGAWVQNASGPTEAALGDTHSTRPNGTQKTARMAPPAVCQALAQSCARAQAVVRPSLALLWTHRVPKGRGGDAL